MRLTRCQEQIKRPVPAYLDLAEEQHTAPAPTAQGQPALDSSLADFFHRNAQS
jgi:hypothetical protein